MIRNDFLVVGVGASAGGIKACKSFLEHVPADSGMCYVVVLHLSPSHESHLAEVLQVATSLPVTQVQGRVHIEPDHVYVIPPNRSLTMSDGDLSITEVTSGAERRAPIDIFFRNLAEAKRSRAVCVVLSGTGADGSMGLKRVKELGGICLAQDPQAAEFGDMPRHSIATGLVDEVLQPEEMPGRIIAYQRALTTLRLPEAPAAGEADVERALREIFTQIRVRHGHDFSNYKRATVLRRIERRMAVHAVSSLQTYAQLVRDRRDEAQALLKDLLISVTNFFRDREAFLALERQIIPLLFEGRSENEQVRAWVPGCATGEEAYSIAMLLAEHAATLARPPSIQVFATDIDEAAVAAAREGLYTLNDSVDVSPERLQRFFREEGALYRVRKELRELVLFAPHNVIKDPPFSHLDLVSCRNLLIYLNTTAQRRVLELFHFALKPGRYLFLGSSESVEGTIDLFTTAHKEAHIFRSRQGETRRPLPVAHLSPPSPTPPLARQGRLVARPLDHLSAADLHQRLLEEYAPPSLVVRDDFKLVHMSPRAGRYLQLGGGEPSHDLLRVARPELRLELRMALHQAAQQRTDVKARGLRLLVDGRPVVVDLLVRPVMREDGPTNGLFLVLFDEQTSDTEAVAPAAPATMARGDTAQHLEDELIRLQAQLRATVDAHEAQAEDLRASNEELVALNEELRASAEELETSKEELQSVNEELRTVNQELKIKIEEQAQAADDIQNLLNSTDIGTVFLDRQLRVQLYTRPAGQIFSLIPADRGRPLLDIRSQLVDTDLAGDIDRVLQKVHVLEREVQTSQGRWYMMRFLPYKTADNRVDGVILTFVDITERRRAEEALRLSEERLRHAIAIETVAIIFFTMEGSITAANNAFFRMSGYTREDLEQGQVRWDDMTPPEYADQWRRGAQELLDVGHTTPYELECIRKDGSRWWALFAATRLNDREGAQFIIEITASKRAQERLRESESRLRAIVDQTTIGIVYADLDGRVLFANQRLGQLLGVEAADVTGRTLRQLTGMQALDEKLNLIRRRAGDDGGFQMEALLDERGGKAMWLNISVSPIRDSDGKLQSIAAVLLDVTDRKRVEQQLRQSEERLRSVVESVTEYAIIVIATDGHIESWNTGAERMFGYSPAEAIGQHANILFTPEDRACGADLEEMRCARENGRAVDERWLVRKDGSRMFVSGVLSPVGGALPAGYVKVARDLTERKQWEDSLQRAHNELERRVTERTRELAQSAEALEAELLDRREAEDQVRKLLARLISIQEEERRRIARDLHDHLGQQMTALHLKLEALRRSAAESGPLQQQIVGTQEFVTKLDRDLDFFTWELRPAALYDLGLVPALGDFVRQWSQNYRIAAEFEALGIPPTRLRPEIEINLYRLAQEALNNIVKHARATAVTVIFQRRDDTVVLTIEDDGVGFDPGARLEVREQAIGLVGMRERAGILGGSLDIESEVGHGTTVIARVPAVFTQADTQDDPNDAPHPAQPANGTRQDS
jgi:two-component system, chemotaxis family, CheB/CheR fusion protein